MSICNGMKMKLRTDRQGRKGTEKLGQRGKLKATKKRAAGF